MSQQQIHIKKFLTTLSNMETGEALARFYHSDILQTELPNQLTPKGALRNLTALLNGAEKGKIVLSGQTYTLKNMIESKATIVAEIKWTGQLRIPIGTLMPNDTMHASFACIFEFKDGLIWRQRNYDCFEPF